MTLSTKYYTLEYEINSINIVMNKKKTVNNVINF